MPPPPDSQRSPARFDAVVVGGSFAGMSAALQLARACRSVAVVDHGRPRNRASERAHGCLGWDGAAPAELLATARRQLLAYPGVQWLTDEAQHASGSEAAGFALACASGRCLHARRLVLAHGVVDHLPDIPGLAERWGGTVLHCPYCHGYEIRGSRLGLLVRPGEAVAEHARALSQWGDLTVFHAGPGLHDEDRSLRQQLATMDVALEASPLQRVSDGLHAHLADGRSVALRALFLHPRTTLAAPLAAQLGCEIASAGCISTDSAKQTTVPGVFACGDAARFAGNIALAIGEGALAGVAAHRSLLGLLD